MCDVKLEVFRFPCLLERTLFHLWIFYFFWVDKIVCLNWTALIVNSIFYLYCPNSLIEFALKASQAVEKTVQQTPPRNTKSRVCSRCTGATLDIEALICLPCLFAFLVSLLLHCFRSPIGGHISVQWFESQHWYLCIIICTFKKKYIYISIWIYIN